MKTAKCSGKFNSVQLDSIHTICTCSEKQTKSNYDFITIKKMCYILLPCLLLSCYYSLSLSTTFFFAFYHCILLTHVWRSKTISLKTNSAKKRICTKVSYTVAFGFIKWFGKKQSFFLSHWMHRQKCRQTHKWKKNTKWLWRMAKTPLPLIVSVPTLFMVFVFILHLVCVYVIFPIQ